MTPEYEQARRIALGLTRAPVEANDPKNMWEVLPLNRTVPLLETPFQFFARDFEAPPELLAQRAALSLFDEYETDRNRAVNSLLRLSSLLHSRTVESIETMLIETPVWDWLSYVFLDEQDLNEQLIDELTKTDGPCRRAVCNAAKSAMERLEAHRELFAQILAQYGDAQ